MLSRARRAIEVGNRSHPGSTAIVGCGGLHPTFGSLTFGSLLERGRGLARAPLPSTQPSEGVGAAAITAGDTPPVSGSLSTASPQTKTKRFRESPLLVCSPCSRDRLAKVSSVLRVSPIGPKVVLLAAVGVVAHDESPCNGRDGDSVLTRCEQDIDWIPQRGIRAGKGVAVQSRPWTPWPTKSRFVKILEPPADGQAHIRTNGSKGDAVEPLRALS